MQRSRLSHLTVWLLIPVITIFWLTPNLYAQMIPRISVQEAQARVSTGEALLVCSYDDRTCRNMLPEGAMLRSQLEKSLPQLPKDREIIFYCS